MAEWSKGTRSEKIRPMARHWAEVGFGTPVALHLFYVVKICSMSSAAGCWCWPPRALTGSPTSAPGGREPIVFQKVVLYTLLFEVVGLGCGFGPLNNRFFPPMGSILYWLRPGTIRLPPWPGRVPFTSGDYPHARRRRALCRAARDDRCSHCFPTAPARFRTRHDGRRAADLADHDDPRPAGGARPARQGDLPGRPRRGVRDARRSRSCSRGVDMIVAAKLRVRRDLDGCRDVEAQQALSLRDRRR